MILAVYVLSRDSYCGVESAALLLALHAAPVWFHRKGRGRFRKAPPEILQAALTGLEKKRPFTVSRSLLKLMSIELVMPSNHLILCRPLLLPPSIFPSI